MTKYWIRENGQQSGPFSLEELQLRTFAKGDTFVWHKGLEGWMHIENVPELAHLIAPEPAAEPEQKAVESEAEVSETPKDMEEAEEAERGFIGESCQCVGLFSFTNHVPLKV